MAKETTAIKNAGYTIVKSLGEGGQARVYGVRRSAEPDGQVFALKVLKTERATPTAIERFHREIESLKGFEHPNIVKIYNDGEADGVRFYLMEFLDGYESLKNLVNTNHNPYHRNAERSLSVYMQVVGALTACEQNNIVHRDLSPVNVLVNTSNDHVKVIDFGCCHFEDGNRMTLTGEAVGTPHYRAPECGGYATSPVTIRSDLYSAGKILWSIVTNNFAFDREDLVFNRLALSQVLNDSYLTWHFHPIFEKTIRRKPDDRYDRATDALSEAAIVRFRLQNRFLPLELLAQGWCPICGVGQVVETGHFYTSDDEAMKDFLGKLTEIAAAMRICPNCGYTSIRSEELQKRNLDRRKKLL